jgi:HEAT repeat protein
VAAGPCADLPDVERSAVRPSRAEEGKSGTPFDDPSPCRTLPALIEAAGSDESWQVRCAVVVRLPDFHSQEVLGALRMATEDEHPEVRWSAAYSLNQLGMS